MLLQVPNRFDHLFGGHRDLRHEDDVGAAREAAHGGDPAGVAAHRLDDHRAVVRARRGAQAIECLRHDAHRRVEADAVIGRREIVIDGLRHTHDADAASVQPLRDTERVVAADRDERVESELPNLFDARPLVPLVLARIGA